MKKLFYLLIVAVFVTAIPEVASAQSNDPFEQETLKATNNGNASREKKINRKKTEQTEEVAPAPKPQPVVKQVVNENNNGMTISNPCSDWLDFEFISLVGSKGAQTVKLSFKITSHEKNARIYVGGNFIAYDSEGEEHNRGYGSTYYDMITDVPVKSSLNVPGKINPNKTTVMPVISFNIDNCRIEMRNVPIDWR